jgi:hypothetical protein
MPKVDMSADAVTTRLKRVSQLRRLGLSLQKAKIKPKRNEAETSQRHDDAASESDKRKG